MERTERDVGTTGRNIRQLREARNWSLTELSKKSGLAISTLSELENGHRQIGRKNTLEKIAAAFDVTVSALWKEGSVEDGGN